MYDAESRKDLESDVLMHMITKFCTPAFFQPTGLRLADVENSANWIDGYGTFVHLFDLRGCWGPGAEDRLALFIRLNITKMLMHPTTRDVLYKKAQSTDWDYLVNLYSEK